MSQTVLLQVDNVKDAPSSVYGPNLKKFTSSVFRLGFVIPSDKKSPDLIYGGSLNLALGVRKKIRIGSVYSLGYDFEIQYTDYKIKQETGKIFPDTILHNRGQRMDYFTTGLGFYNRFNFDPHRGNYLGHFLDLGIMGEWNFSVKEISKDKLMNGTLGKVVRKSLPYTNAFDAKVYARLGISHVSLYGSYRFTDLFKNKYAVPELPSIIAGIDLALFN